MRVGGFQTRFRGSFRVTPEVDFSEGLSFFFAFGRAVLCDARSLSEDPPVSHAMLPRFPGSPPDPFTFRTAWDFFSDTSPGNRGLYGTGALRGLSVPYADNGANKDFFADGAFSSFPFWLGRRPLITSSPSCGLDRF